MMTKEEIRDDVDTLLGNAIQNGELRRVEEQMAGEQ